MTKNREDYLNSISNEERFLRDYIKEIKTQIKFLKKSFKEPSSKLTLNEKERKKLIKQYYRLIKTLKYRIPMRYLKRNVSILLFYICPSCYSEVCTGDAFCDNCGQKLKIS